MANRRVSIYKYVRLSSGWRYCKPVTGANNKIKPNWVITPEGKEEHHPEGNYYLNIAGDWKMVGPNAADAATDAKREMARLAARAQGLEVKSDSIKDDGPSGTLAGAIQTYLDNMQDAVGAGNRRPRTYVSAKFILDEFQRFAKKRYLKDITRKTLTDYVAWAKTQSPSKSARTSHNKFIRVNQFLKFNDIKVAKNSDGPKISKNDPVHVYDDVQLAKFFAACNPFQNVIFNTFQKGGLRESELKYAHWSSLNLDKGYLTIEPRHEYGYVPKTGEVRDVYLPPDLIEQLRILKVTAKHKLIFPTKGGLPNEKLLRTCKRIGQRAGLDPDEFWLHKFRSTYATTCLRNGMDIETLRSQMGHSANSKSIWRYLTALKNEQRAAKVAQVWAVVPQMAAAAVATQAIQ
jgi:integrase/recombinase XerD